MTRDPPPGGKKSPTRPPTITTSAAVAAARPNTSTILEQIIHRRGRNNTTGSSSLHEPLKKSMSSYHHHHHHEPLPYPATVGINLYGDWGGQDDSVNNLQVDPAIYDYNDDDDDDDDVSEAGSEFTADYSRHRLNHENDDLIPCPLEDLDDESSLSSQGSFGVEDNGDNNEDDDWSYESTNASSAVDSRALARQRPSHDNQYLLNQDPTDFSLDEDPLFNADGTVKAFDMSLSSPRKALPRTVQEGQESWSDDDDDDGDNKKKSEKYLSFVPEKVWKETEHGNWVAQSVHADITVSTSSQTPHPASIGSSIIVPFPHPAAPPVRRNSSLSTASTDSSVESFATKDKSYPISPVALPSNPTTTITTTTKGPVIPLRPDPKLRVDDSSSEDEGSFADELQRQQRALSTTLEEVLVFSDNEEVQEKANPSTMVVADVNKLSQQSPTQKSVADLKSSPREKKKGRRTSASNMGALINKYSVETGDAGDNDKDHAFQKHRRSKSHQNPIVPTPLSPTLTMGDKPSIPRISILSQSTPHGHMENESPIATVEDPLQYSMDFSQSLRISPTEHRAPLKVRQFAASFILPPEVVCGLDSILILFFLILKDHSKRPHKKRKSPKNEKKSSKKKNASKPNTNETEGVPGENHAATDQINSDQKVDGIDFLDDDCSVGSDASNDSLDAAVGKQSSKKDSKKKKTKDKDRIRKRGRKSDWWGADDDDDDDNNNNEYGAEDAAHKVSGVADRVEAIFANKQIIFHTTLHDDPPTSQNPSIPEAKPETKVRGRSIPVEEEHQHQHQPQTIRVKSKAAEEETQESKPRREESTRIRSKSKSRGRSVSKDRSSKASRSLSKSKDASSVSNGSRSRSKSVNKEKFRSRSTSCNNPKVIDRTKSDGNLRRRVKKDSSFYKIK